MIQLKHDIQITFPQSTEPLGLTGAYERDATANQIEADIESFAVQAYDDGPRSHLGASVLGHECARYLWFMFRWMYREQFSGRILRLFQRGHREEDVIIAYLRSIGCQVEQGTTKQATASALNGHFGGSIDSRVLLPERYGIKEWILLECKTHKDGTKFDMLKSVGIIKHNPQHYVQMCVYGRLFNLRYALYICVNKNDDDMDIELIELDWSLADAQLARAEGIITSWNPPSRISDNPSFWKCKWCSMQPVCQLNAAPERNCRSCQWSMPTSNAQWHCHKFNAVIPKDVIPKGCQEWQALPH